MPRIQYVLSLVFILCGLLSIGQINPNQLEGVVVDGTTNKTISYVHILIKGKKVGTVTNLDGSFVLNSANPTDVLVFSFLGYEVLELSYGEVKRQQTIKLFPIAEVLSEVTLVNDDAWLYDLIANSRKTLGKRLDTAKSYFSLNSFIDGFQVEMQESYFNGVFRGYDLSRLDLKNGRISFKPTEENYFVSIATSNALIAHRLFDKSDYFPVSPFELKRKKLEERFFLHLESKFRDSEERVVYAVKYRPRIETEYSFYGKVWLDSASGSLLKVELNADSTKLSPFVTIFPKDSLLYTSFRISKTFEEQNGKMYVQSIDFDYDLEYKSHRQGVYTVSSNAVLYAYDYQNAFILPFYDVPSNYMHDYRRIASAPYNDYFWENIQEFKIEVSESNARFAQQQVLINGHSDLLWSANMGNEFFQQNYIQWSEYRMRIKDKLPKGTVYEDLDGMLPSNRYDLFAHLYADVNTFEDSTHYLVSAVYDPFRSFFHYPDSKLGDAFINMFFDLYEIEKRELERNLLALETPDLNQIRTLYEASLERAQRNSRKYIKEVERGKDELSFERWNDFIKKELGIDNIEFYGLGWED